jgi:hypothetical protein
MDPVFSTAPDWTASLLDFCVRLAWARCAARKIDMRIAHKIFSENLKKYKLGSTNRRWESNVIKIENVLVTQY